MRKLLKANFVRLFKNKIFYLCCAVMFIIGTVIPISHHVDNLKNGAIWTPDNSCFAYIIPSAILLSLMTAFYIGREYSDKTVRNKLIVGHTRFRIYISNLIVCAVAGFVLCIAYILPHTAFSLALLGNFESSLKEILIYTGLGFSLITALAALFTAISMLCQSRAGSTAVCILLVFMFLFAGIRIVSALNEPEYYPAYSYTQDDVTVTEDEQKNPNYLYGVKRQIYEFLYDFTPGGQFLRISNANSPNPMMSAAYNAIIVLAATGFGIIFFNKKDLK